MVSTHAVFEDAKVTALSDSLEVAKTYSHQIKNYIDKPFAQAEILGRNLSAQIDKGLQSRERSRLELLELLKGDSRYLATWSAWEPNAFDGNDAKYANHEFHEKSGRHYPWWIRQGDNLTYKTLLNPETPDLGDWYFKPIQSESADYPSAVGTLHTGLKAIWHFNEASWPHSANDVLDSSGNGNHGTSYGNARIYTTGLGKFGNTGSWNASGDYVVGPASSTFIVTDNQAFSVSAWIYANAIGTTGSTTIDNRIITIHRGSSAAATFSLGLGASNKLIGYSYNNGGTELYLNSTATISTWQWYLVTATYNGTCLQLYINGTATGSCTNTYINAGGSYGIRIGNFDTTTGFFRGYLDDMGVWSKALSANEVKEIYRRYNNRIRYQVRSCSSSDCSDQTSATNSGWKGPDNTGSTFFSELYNTSANTIGGSILGTSPTMTFSNFAGLSVTSNRYFQYRAFFDNEDTAANCTYNSAAAACSPELKSVTVGANRYDSTSPSFTATGAAVTAVYQVLDSNGFTETLGSNGCSAGAKYALSADGSTFYYYNGTSWTTSSDYSTASSAAQLNAGLNTFAATAGAGTLRVKAYLKSSANTQCEIDNLQITGKKY